MKNVIKITGKVIVKLFPFAIIFFLAFGAYSDIKEHFEYFHYNIDLFEYVCYLIVACTVWVLVWVTWLYRKLKKKLDQLLEEKEERLFVLRHAQFSAADGEDCPPDGAPANELPEQEEAE